MMSAAFTFSPISSDPSAMSAYVNIYEAKKQDLGQAAGEGKVLEWNAHRVALCQSYQQHHLEAIDSIQIPDPKTELSEKVTRLFMQLYKHEGMQFESSECIEKLLNLLHDDSTCTEEKIFQFLRQEINKISGSFSDEFVKLHASELFLLVTSCKNFTSEWEQLKNKIKEIHHFFENTLLAEQPISLGRKNVVECRTLLDGALHLPAYKLCKHDENNGYVRFLHMLSIASFAKPKVVSAYSHLGNMIFANNDLSLLEAWQKARETLNEQKNTIKTKIEANRPEHATKESENNSGTLYKEKFSLGENNLTARVIVCPRVTENEQITRFHAILQSIENQRLNHNLYMRKVMQLAYTNLQNFYKGDEGESSQTLMKLNDLYPFSFSGISIATNSQYIDMQNKNHSIDEDLKEGLYKELTDDRNFHLPNEAINEKGGYYFPPNRKNEFIAVIKQIIDIAYNVISESKPEEILDNTCAEAFGELVRFGLVHYHELKCLADLKEEPLPEKVAMFVLRICKGCVDRGAKTNAGLLWGTDPELLESRIISIIQSRAAITGGRPAGNMQKFQALLKTVSRSTFTNFLNEVAKIALPNDKLNHRLVL
jgi:hypothetical protein